MTRNPNMREAILSAAELLFSTHGFNVAKGKRVDLTLILKPNDT